ncbi:FAS1 domain-containing protein [Naematelia encephala]|uniref:FAS1 domain-containing protein n=1 Tax=Naematelia encephala TaxID=71784 RepID=A0A1Y2ASK8_9TREE|nr:FAS1 domain-containing protein [Naematelia encephala]
MKLSLSLLPLLPIVLAAPTTKQQAPELELSLSQWAKVQSGFFEGLRSLSTWSWEQAEELLESVDDNYDEQDQTIWKQLQADTNSFSRLVKIINFEKNAIKVLDDPNLQVTFFAPNNDALKPPEHHHDDDDDDDDDSVFSELIRNPSLATLSAALDADPSLTSTYDDDDAHYNRPDGNDDDDDDKKKRRKEIFKYIAGQVLQYHVLPKAYTAQELARNYTIETSLKATDGSLAGLHRRIRIVKSVVPPQIEINFYAKLLVTDKKARNGIFHTLDAPLIPPPSLFEEAYLFPKVFSTLTSAVQRLHATKYLDWEYDRENSSPGKPRFHGTPLTTLFAPTNEAFNRLPDKLRFFLFSPFGERALDKILQYHDVPDTLLLSEFVYFEKHHGDGHGHHHHGKDGHKNVEMIDFFDDAGFHKELEVHTALPNSTLKIVIDKTQVVPIEGAVKINIKVNGQDVQVVDVPARNGALHVLDHILVPPHKHRDHDHDHDHDLVGADAWADWEEWLPAWADAQ